MGGECFFGEHGDRLQLVLYYIALRHQPDTKPLILLAVRDSVLFAPPSVFVVACLR